MRIAIAALCVLALTAPSQAVGLFCLALKSVPAEFQREPSVPFRAYTIPADLLNEKYCSDPDQGGVVGCAYPRTGDPTRWIIVIADTVSAEDYPCVLAYEKAHLPPNCWGDPKVEHPGAMDFLAKDCPSATPPSPTAN